MLDCDNAIEPAMLSPQGSGYEVMPYVYRELRAASLLQHCPCIHSQVEMSDGKETRGAEQTRISGCAAIIWQLRPRRLAAGKPSEDESKKKGSSCPPLLQPADGDSFQNESADDRIIGYPKSQLQTPHFEILPCHVLP
jgi:hypothetical protein